jgi:hypothetical protein
VLLAVYVALVAVAEVRSVPSGFVPCQYHELAADDDALVKVTDPQFGDWLGASGASGMGLIIKALEADPLQQPLVLFLARR